MKFSQLNEHQNVWAWTELNHPENPLILFFSYRSCFCSGSLSRFISFMKVYVCALCTFYCSINNTLCLSFIDCTKRFFLRFPKRVCTILTSNKQNQTDVSSTHQLPILMKTKNIQQQKKSTTRYMVHCTLNENPINIQWGLLFDVQPPNWFSLRSSNKRIADAVFVWISFVSIFFSKKNVAFLPFIKLIWNLWILYFHIRLKMARCSFSLCIAKLNLM